ncbi:MAG TPA: hypothetical protein VEQ10_19545, partial [Vicinamibacteria bacterium]|nr:hypothetical protein [Vicinamibacteria bacterium]
MSSGPKVACLAAAMLVALAAGPSAAFAQPAEVSVRRQADGTLVLSTPAAEFRLLPSGELRGALRQGDRLLSLQEEGPGETVEVAGSPAAAIRFDIRAAEVTDVHGGLGDGKRVSARSTAGPAPLEAQLEVEVWSAFPAVAVSSVRYRNAGHTDLTLDRVMQQAHRLSAASLAPGRPPFEMWSFHGASVDWGQDEAVPLARDFKRPNRMGEQLPNGSGGGVPVVAFWTRAAGLAVGHLAPVPLVASLPVEVGKDGRVAVALVVEPHRKLPPGADYQAPRSFLSVFSGDFYAPLRLYSRMRQGEGWPIPRPSVEAYAPAWCGWGYESEVTPAQMLGTIPKLKELGVHWATLDDRWFENYGDWRPRKDTFPGNALRELADGFHKEGIKVQLWWLPLAVEDGSGKYESHAYGTSQ